MAIEERWQRLEHHRHQFRLFSEELTISATCLLNSKGTSSTVSEEKLALPNDKTIITASCPSGSLVTGGGWSVENNAPVKIFISAKSGNDWQISVHNPTDISPKVTAFAICLTGASAAPQYDKKENKVPANSTASAQMNCPAGYVTGGGSSSIRIDLVPNNTRGQRLD